MATIALQNHKVGGIGLQIVATIAKKHDGTMNVLHTATRGEISAMLRRYVELGIDRITTEGWTTNDSGSALYYQDGKAVTGAKTIGNIAYNFNSYGETNRQPALLASNKKYIIYKIVKGDTLWDLARKQGTTVNAIVALNNIQNRNAVPVGAEIKIPQK